MENDCCIHVRKCHKCQAFADNVNAPPIPLNVLATPWPFSMWGIDVIKAIEPKASNGHRFILVAKTFKGMGGALTLLAKAWNLWHFLTWMQ